MRKLKSLIFRAVKNKIKGHKARRRLYRGASLMLEGGARVFAVIAVFAAFGGECAAVTAICLIAFSFTRAVRGAARERARTLLLPIMFFISLGAITDIVNKTMVLPFTLETLGYLLKTSWYSFVLCLLLGVFTRPAKKRGGLPPALYKGSTVFLICYFFALSLYVISALPKMAITEARRNLLAGGITAVWVALPAAMIISLPFIQKLVKALNNLF